MLKVRSTIVSFLINPFVAATENPPITEAGTWLREEKFGPDMPLIDVCQAVPGYPPESGLRDHVSHVARLGDSAFYTDVEGLPELRSGLASEMAGFYGGSINEKDVLITAGCNQAYMVAMMTVAKSGSSVILPAPWYFNHKMTLDMLGIESIPLPCSASQNMIPDVALAESLIQPSTRAIVLVSPNNPTGSIYPAETIAAFVALAKRKGIALVIDETYRDFLPPEMGAPHQVFSDPEWREAGFIHLYSFSKSLAITGYRVGAMVADPDTIVQAAKILDCMAICAPSLSQHGVLYGLQHLGEWRLQKRQLMADRVTAFTRALESSESRYRLVSIGAYFAYLEHPFEGEDAKSVAIRLAAENNLLCLPGTMFGPDQQQMLRFAFANVDTDIIPNIVQRLL